MPVDIHLDEDGDLRAFNRLASGSDLVAQRIRTRLRTHLGDWLIDSSKGLPWATWFSTKPAPVDEAQARIRAELVDTPGVVRVSAFEVSVTDRVFTVTATVVAEEGEVDINARAFVQDRNFAVSAHVRNSGRIAS